MQVFGNCMNYSARTEFGQLVLLWAATMAETAVRLPAFRMIENGAALGTVGGTALAMLIGGGLLTRYRERLVRQLQRGTRISAS